MNEPLTCAKQQLTRKVCLALKLRSDHSDETGFLLEHSVVLQKKRLNCRELMQRFSVRRSVSLVQVNLSGGSSTLQAARGPVPPHMKLWPPAPHLDSPPKYTLLRPIPVAPTYLACHSTGPQSSKAIAFDDWGQWSRHWLTSADKPLKT